jgi:hypothetical protein
MQYHYQRNNNNLKRKEMKIFKYFINAIVWSGMILASCSQDINLSDVDVSKYDVSNKTLAVVTDKFGNTNKTASTFRDADSTAIYVSLTNSASNNTTLSLSYDKTVLEQYNKTNGTSYQALPENLVELPAQITVQKGSTQSERTYVKYVTSADLESEGTYAIPLAAKSGDNSVTVSGEKGSMVILVKDVSKLPDAKKASGCRMISCMEVRSNNPINHLSYTLKSSGKPFFDEVIIFSSNCMFNKETGRIYLFHESGCKTIFNNAEKYIRPLQLRGIKVLLSVVPNHDGVGLANLPDDQARYMAKLISETVYSYGLDGVFFDEEYADYSSYSRPGLYSSGSTERASRLLYECKKAMPDKTISVYAYSTLTGLGTVDGVPAGEYCDEIINDYLDSSDRTTGTFIGVEKKNMAIYSQELALDRYASDAALQTIRNGGYSNMVFSLAPFRNTGNYFTKQVPALQKTARILFDDELVCPMEESGYLKIEW